MCCWAYYRMLHRSACWQLNYLCAPFCWLILSALLLGSWTHSLPLCICLLVILFAHWLNPFVVPDWLLSYALCALYWRLHSLNSWWPGAWPNLNQLVSFRQPDSYEECSSTRPDSYAELVTVCDLGQRLACLIVIVCGNLISAFCSCVSVSVSLSMSPVSVSVPVCLAAPLHSLSLLSLSLSISMSLFASETLLVRARTQCLGSF